MLLVAENENNGWIRSTFNLTYRVSWPQLLLAVHGVIPYFANPQVLVDDAQVPISRQTDILSIPRKPHHHAARHLHGDQPLP